MPEVFTLSFNAKHTEETDGVLIYMTLSDKYNWLRVEREGARFCLLDSFNHRMYVDTDCIDTDIVNIYIEQGEHSRSLTVTSVAKGTKFKSTGNFMPVGMFNEMRLRV